MGIEEKKTVDMLTESSVSILTQKFIEIDGVPTQVGDNHRKAYVNSVDGRESLQKSEPEKTVNTVFSMWGDTPTVTDAPEEVAEKE